MFCTKPSYAPARAWGSGHSDTLLEEQKSEGAATEGDQTRPTNMTKATASDPVILLPGILLLAHQGTYTTRVFTAAFCITAMG